MDVHVVAAPRLPVAAVVVMRSRPQHPVIPRTGRQPSILFDDIPMIGAEGRNNLSTLESTQVAQGRAALQRAKRAAVAYADFNSDRVISIVRAVAEEAYRHAEEFAEKTVRECKFGVVADKIVKNRSIAGSFIDQYAGVDYCSHRVDRSAKLIVTPRPAGVVLAITPATSPVAAIYFKVLCALLTRNAIVVSPHPLVTTTCVEATAVLAGAAVRAGAPADLVQILPEPSIPLVEAMMADDNTNLILATGGAGVVRAAYSSGTPSIGVGPGNPPVIVDETADIRAAGRHLVKSKAFDNSVLCTAESVLFAIGSIASELADALRDNGAHICSATETRNLREYVYPGGRFNSKVVGLDAGTIAQNSGFGVAAGTKLLVTPIDHIVDEERLTHEKLSPVLALRVVPSFSDAVREAKALLQIVGIGHSAVIHSNDAQRVLDFSVTMPVHRITVNAPGSLGNAGFGTGLPMTMSVGTGFVGGSSTGDNLNPEHLVQWSRTAYASNDDFPDFEVMTPDQSFPGRGSTRSGEPATSGVDLEAIRGDLRRIVLEELRELIGTR